MTEKESFLKGKHILAVDDEEDILETIEEILEDSKIDTACDYQSASQKIKRRKYDLAILDIMGVDGLQLLSEAVEREIPTLMLTAHAISPDTLKESIQKGAMSYLPKESLADLEDMLNDLLEAFHYGEPPWKLLFDKLGDYFDERFGSDWKEKDAFFKEFEERLKRE